MKTTKTKRLTLRQRDFLRAYAENYGNISEAARASGVPRRTVYNWLERSIAFIEACDRIMDEVFDFAMERLFELIRKGSVRATIFFLKTYCKDRSYC